MYSESNDYTIFFDFFKAYFNSGIKRIDSNDPMVLKLNERLEKNKQIFYISDAILFDILYINKSVFSMFGVEPEKVHQGYFLTTTHPEDFKRHSFGRSKLISMAQDLFNEKSGFKILSSNVRARKSNGSYFQLLYQACLFYSEVPYASVFLILVATDLSDFNYIPKKFHFYNGDDKNLFRFPDEELLKIGNVYSQTEFKIIELIEAGLSSKEIADKLFRSVNTINTHRTNILKKSGKSTIAEVIRDLKNYGLL